MRLEENVENGNPPTWKALLKIFKVKYCGKQRQMGGTYCRNGAAQLPAPWNLDQGKENHRLPDRSNATGENVK